MCVRVEMYACVRRMYVCENRNACMCKENVCVCVRIEMYVCVRSMYVCESRNVCM